MAVIRVAGGGDGKGLSVVKILSLVLGAACVVYFFTTMSNSAFQQPDDCVVKVTIPTSAVETERMVQDPATRHLAMAQVGIAGLSHKMYSLQALHAELDKEIKEKNPTEEVEGNTGNAVALFQRLYYTALARYPAVTTICETGFNGGHSALVWLNANPQARMYSFDLGNHDYHRTGAQVVEKNFPGKFTLTVGDSTETVPAFFKQHPNVTCNIISVDGGHTYDVARIDLLNFRKVADPHFHIIVVDDMARRYQDVEHISYMYGPSKAWRDLVTSGDIAEGELFQYIPERGFVVGAYSVPGKH